MREYQFDIATDYLYTYVWAVDNIVFHIPSVAIEHLNYADTCCYKIFRHNKNITAGFILSSVDIFLYPFTFHELKKLYATSLLRQLSLWLILPFLAYMLTTLIRMD